jgi:protein phosphatase
MPFFPPGTSRIRATCRVRRGSPYFADGGALAPGTLRDWQANCTVEMVGGAMATREESYEVESSRNRRPGYATTVGRPGVFGMTDRGLVRETNEDQFLIGEIEQSLFVLSSSRPVEEGQQVIGAPQGHVLIVADGIGGNEDGEIASGVVTDTVARYSFMLVPWALMSQGRDSLDMAGGLRNAVHQAQANLRNVADEEGVDSRMGTTLTAAFVDWPDLYVVHAGDSRFYAYRDGLHRVTRDHTVAQELVDKEAISPEQARKSPFGNILVNAVGGSNDDLDVDLHHAELIANDILMLCTDGLTAHVSDAEIEDAIGRIDNGLSLEQCVHDLIESAKRDGGTDNITVVMARY